MDYLIKSIGKNCAGTGEPLLPGSRCRSVLVERDGQVLRLDFAEKNWPGQCEDMIGSWVCIVPDGPKKKQELDLETCLEMFTQLIEQPNRVQEKMAYVLALLLLKKHRLILEQTRVEEEQEYLVLQGSLGEGPFEMRNLKLDDQEIVQLQREMIESGEFASPQTEHAA